MAYSERTKAEARYLAEQAREVIRYAENISHEISRDRHSAEFSRRLNEAIAKVLTSHGLLQSLIAMQKEESGT